MDDPDLIRYLTDEQTRAACASLDPAIAVRQALTAQGRGEVEIAAEAYLGCWSADHAWPGAGMRRPMGLDGRAPSTAER